MERILITGASGGIGRAICVRLAGPDRILLLHGRNHEALDKTSRLVREKGAQAVTITADLARTAEVEKVAADAGGEPLHVLINNAGITFVRPVESITSEEWQKTFAVNVTAPFLLTQKLLPLMSEGAAVVNIMSVAARTGFPGWGSYCMSKFALEGFTQCLREELRSRGIRVINIYPAATATGMWDNVEGQWPRDKMLPPEETAEAVAYALSRPPAVMVENISVGNVGGNL